MTRNKLIDLNNHLFEALERINDDKYLAEEEYIQKHIQRVIDLKKGNALPEGCGKCPYCIKNKRLENFIEVDDLLD